MREDTHVAQLSVDLLGKAFPTRMLEPSCSNRQGLAAVFTGYAILAESGKETSQVVFS
jgi:hypothetical protein